MPTTTNFGTTSVPEANCRLKLISNYFVQLQKMNYYPVQLVWFSFGVGFIQQCSLTISGLYLAQHEVSIISGNALFFTEH